jgi:DNA polymerase (family 10)
MDADANQQLFGLSPQTVAAEPNFSVAARLDEVAQLLEQQGANLFRVGAYRRAAQTVRALAQPIDQIVKTEGIVGLKQLPGIGETLSRFIYQLVTTGQLPMLDRLRGESDPIAMLRTVPGIGRQTAERLYRELGIETLEELELAAYDGRLARVLGFGPKRIAGVRDSLATRLGGIRRSGFRPKLSQPPVSEILDVDREYRQKCRQDALTKIAPRRFNPRQEQWLPILHTERGNRHYTALFSNTARAHELNKTGDWVVIYYDGGWGERQCTVVTARYGSLTNRRIVRGREEECEKHYLKPVNPPLARQRPLRDGFSI